MSRKPKATATLAEQIAAKQAAVDNEARAATAPTKLVFVVLGEPVGKERARVFRKERADGRVVTRAVTPEKTREYEAKVKIVAKLAANRAGWAWSKHDRFSVVMRVWRTHESRGSDLDNLIKTCDALNGVLWGDDRYVRGIGAAFLAPDPKNPRVEIEVTRYRKAAT
jgi:Holliday junction resolvase RusA-like endonuclease